jgi:hypothetical protein
MRNTNNKLRKIIVFYQNLILKENQKQPSKLLSKGLILIFHQYTKTKTGNTYYFCMIKAICY